jgi:hypothetical protein
VCIERQNQRNTVLTIGLSCIEALTCNSQYSTFTKDKTLTEPLVPKKSLRFRAQSQVPKVYSRLEPPQEHLFAHAPTPPTLVSTFADRLTACSSNFPLPQVLVKPIPAFSSPAIFTSSPSSVLFFFLLRRRRSTFTPKTSTTFVNHTSPTCTG